MNLSQVYDPFRTGPTPFPESHSLQKHGSRQQSQRQTHKPNTIPDIASLRRPHTFPADRGYTEGKHNPPTGHRVFQPLRGLRPIPHRPQTFSPECNSVQNRTRAHRTPELVRGLRPISHRPHTFSREQQLEETRGRQQSQRQTDKPNNIPDGVSLRRPRAVSKGQQLNRRETRPSHGPQHVSAFQTYVTHSARAPHLLPRAACGSK